MKIKQSAIAISVIAATLMLSSPLLAQASCRSGDDCGETERCIGPEGSKECYKTCTVGSTTCTAPKTCGQVTGFTPTVCVETCGSVQCSHGQICGGPTDHRACYQACTLDAAGLACPEGKTCGSLEGSTRKACTESTAEAAPAAPESIPFTPITPNLGVQIPGTTLSAPTNDNGVVRVSFLAQYINGAYKYLSAVVLVVAIVMCVYGGFIYLVGSAGISDIKRGKKIILDSIMGMIIILSAYAILNTVNPNTTNLKFLEMGFVQTEGIELISPEAYTAATGIPIPSRADVAAAVSKIAREENIDECIINAIVLGESGGNPNAIGYDSNVARAGVGSRVLFIASGKKYSNSTFTIQGVDPQPTGTWRTQECSKIPTSPAQITALTDRSIMNDAHFDPAKPDFGIDKRFSIGLGFAQYTLHPEGAACELPRCENGQLGTKLKAGGICYTIPEMLKPEVQLIGVVNLMKTKMNYCRAHYTDPYLQERCLNYLWAGSGCSARVSACRKTKLWAACKGRTSREQENCVPYWTVGKTTEYCKDLTKN